MPSAPGNASANEPSSPSNPSPVLLRFVDEELALAPALVERVLEETLKGLRDAPTRQATLGERSQRQGLIEALQARSGPYQEAFVQALRAAVQANLAEQTGGAASPEPSVGSGLELMDESRIEVDIEISRAMQAIDTAAEWELRELQTFTSTLIGQVHVSAESNPFRPLAYAAALWEAACAASPVHVHRTELLRASAAVAGGLLRKAWAAACTRLESRGVEPGIYRTVLLTPGTTPAREPTVADQGATGALAALHARMPDSRSAAAPPVAPDPAPTGRRSPEFEQGLVRLDELLRHLPAGGATARDQAPNLVKRLNLHRAALSAALPDPADRRSLELIARLFDSILTDPQVPAVFVTVLVRLQAAALRLAMLDPGFGRSTAHPFWGLLNRIGESAAGYPAAGDERAAALLTYCQALVDPLARSLAPDTALFGRALARLDAFLDEQLQAQLRASAPALQALERAERREALEQQLVLRLQEQVAIVPTTGTLQRFLTGVWGGVLAESMLRDGEEAESTVGYIQLVDQLLWSLRLPDHPQSRQRLASLLPGMLQRLKNGMALVKLPESEQSQVLDDLLRIHTRALRQDSAAETDALTSEQIVQRMRDESLAPVSGHGVFGDSVIDLGTLQTVPAELLPDASIEEPARRSEALRVGERLRVLLQGRWTRVQVLWRSERGWFVLLAGERPGRTHSIAIRAVQRLATAGLLQPLESRPLVQRAIDNLTRELPGER